jgi:hypothetical protein
LTDFDYFISKIFCTFAPDFEMSGLPSPGGVPKRLQKGALHAAKCPLVKMVCFCPTEAPDREMTET